MGMESLSAKSGEGGSCGLRQKRRFSAKSTPVDLIP